MQHHKAPWKQDMDLIHEGSSPYCVIARANTYQEKYLYNAAHIVKCVNCHDELIEALEAAIKQIKSSKEFNAPIKQSFSVQNLVENTLKKALAKAKGA